MSLCAVAALAVGCVSHVVALTGFYAREFVKLNFVGIKTAPFWTFLQFRVVVVGSLRCGCVTLSLVILPRCCQLFVNNEIKATEQQGHRTYTHIHTLTTSDIFTILNTIHVVLTQSH